MADRIEVSMKLERVPSWLSWVGAVTTALNGFGRACDLVEVAGRSGYAFALSVNRGVCPSGPTSLEWSELSSGVLDLGRSAVAFVTGDCYTDDLRNERTRAHARTAFEMVRREVEAGRPCVVWGLGIPEFGVVRGVEGDEYLTLPYGPVPDRVRWDEVDAPGGPYALAFPTEVLPRGDLDRRAIRRGVRMLGRPDHAACSRCGTGAYDFWIDELAKGGANGFGNSYNAQCWAEARAHARDFTARIAERSDVPVDAIGSAHAAFTVTAAALGAVANLFPFEPGGPKPDAGTVTDPSTIETTIKHLRAAKASDEQALRALRAAIEEWPEESGA